MLLHLSIRNIVLIESLDIPFSTGLCVLTGETGAGKSILLDALGFVLGDRGGQKLLRHGAAQGSVAAEFEVEHSSAVAALLEDQGIEAAAPLVLRRVVYADGKNKCFINDVSVSVMLLKTMGELLVEMHGQHEQRGLLEPATHRAIIDAYGDLGAQLLQVKASYQTWQESRDKLESLLAAQAEAAREEDYLRHIAGELRQLAPETGEEEELAGKRTLLMSREKLASTLESALAELTGNRNVESALLAAQRILVRNSAVAPEGCFDQAVEALERAAVEVHEAIESIEKIAQDMEGGEDRLEAVEERLFALRAASRKFNLPVDALGAYLEEIEAKLALLSNQQADAALLASQAAEARARYIAVASHLTEARKATALKLEQALLAELAPLKMGNTRFEVACEPYTEKEWSVQGMDKMYFLASTNPGSPLAPLAKIASGGELSRFMLAIKVVLADVNAVPTMIFDEVDTGIGGAVADAVGKRLKSLGAHVQVLVVTHQPQVAAKGMMHLKVQKEVKEGVTSTAVIVLSITERKEELARMLAGEHITHEARAAADKLLEVTY